MRYNLRARSQINYAEDSPIKPQGTSIRKAPKQKRSVKNFGTKLQTELTPLRKPHYEMILTPIIGSGSKGHIVFTPQHKKFPSPTTSNSQMKDVLMTKPEAEPELPKVDLDFRIQEKASEVAAPACE
ncbi:unnamed protein product [Orchesella dallaii]|uniref:Uncharacterized protein n=1 Tax=Orchesella dallaii TaxID=48710 RepID=A0ABP1QMR3_9HEXA